MAVSRLDSSGASLRAVNAAKAISRIVKVDSILTRVAKISQLEEMAPAMLDRIINTDAVLGQRVPLAVAAYCAEKKKPLPGSLGEATGELSYDAVRKIVLLVGISEIHKELESRCQMSAAHLTNQAVAVATASEYLGVKAGQPACIAFAAGLFANLGIATLASSERGYHAICSSVAGGTVQLHEAEFEALTCTHADAGYCLLTDFGFPEPVCAVAGNHTKETPSSLVFAVSVAEALAHQLGFDGGFAIVPPNFDPAVLTKLGAPESDAERLVVEITNWNSLAAKILA